MKHKCPKCLMADHDNLRNSGKDLPEINKLLSLVCNVSPTPPKKADPCQCDADWIPDKTGE